MCYFHLWRRTFCGQEELERAALAWYRLYPNTAAAELDDLFTDEKAEATSLETY